MFASLRQRSGKGDLDGRLRDRTLLRPGFLAWLVGGLAERNWRLVSALLADITGDGLARARRKSWVTHYGLTSPVSAPSRFLPVSP